MVAVKVVMEGNVCCACRGGVRAFPLAASHGRWLVEEFIIAATIFSCGPTAQKAQTVAARMGAKLFR